MPIYIYLRRTHSVLGAEDVDTYRKNGTYSNPNDYEVTLNPDNFDVQNNPDSSDLFHLEDLATASR